MKPKKAKRKSFGKDIPTIGDTDRAIEEITKAHPEITSEDEALYGVPAIPPWPSGLPAFPLMTFHWPRNWAIASKPSKRRLKGTSAT